MEHQLVAPLDGTVHISIAPEDLVKADQVLATIHPVHPTAPAPPDNQAEDTIEKPSSPWARRSNTQQLQHQFTDKHHRQHHRQGAYHGRSLNSAGSPGPQTPSGIRRRGRGPGLRQHDDEHSFPIRSSPRWRHRPLRLPFPEERRHGRRLLRLALALEQLGRVDSPSPSRWRPASPSAHADPPVRNEAQKEESLPLGFRRGARRLGLSGPEAGSERRHHRPPPSSSAAESVINGNKEFITNSGTEHHPARHGHRVTGQEDARTQHQAGNLQHPGAHQHPGSKAEKAYDKVRSTPRTPTR